MLWKCQDRLKLFQILVKKNLGDLCCVRHCEEHSCLYKNLGISIFERNSNDLSTLQVLFIGGQIVEFCFIYVKSVVFVVVILP